VWVYGSLCVRDGQTLTQTAPSRNTSGSLALLRALDQTYPQGDRSLVADNLASHLSGPLRDWRADHPRIQHAFIPVGAAWLNLIEGW
jgi:DDE superfamily endonuclease